MTQITSHVLDTARGVPAQGIKLSFFTVEGETDTLIGEAVTNSDGRVSDFIGSDAVLAAGIYKLSFALSAYFTSHAVEHFYPQADILFKIAGDGQHYHVPLLLNPFGYSTYRGS